ncbi:MAG: hypothetical protein RI565_03205 [Schleiferiaceae bacterium]|jgi:hypothetical protein|nr:hypothetical protein [Schleiferiaceae bacterium]
MKSKNTFIIHPETTEQETALKAFIQALNIEFEVSQGKPYDSDFVDKIKESRQQVKEGKTTRVEREDIKEFLGL